MMPRSTMRTILACACSQDTFAKSSITSMPATLTGWDGAPDLSGHEAGYGCDALVVLGGVPARHRFTKLSGSNMIRIEQEGLVQELLCSLTLTHVVSSHPPAAW